MQIEPNTFICADSIEVLREMQEETIDLVWTSPPYNLGNFSKGSFYYGKSKGTKLQYDSHSDNMPEEEYIAWQHDILRNCFRLLKPTGAIFYNHKPTITNGIYNDRRNLIPQELPIRQVLIWDRCCMVNFSGSFYAPTTERIYIIAKPEWRPMREFLGNGEVWRVPPEVNTVHPAPFPVKLSTMVCGSGCVPGGIVLDPFSGSGTTAIACHKTKRRFLCIEKSEEYIKIAQQRYAELIAQQELFGQNEDGAQ